jgi:hypothetical protein
VEWLIRYRGNDYANKYTKDIYAPNAFSSSVLVYSVEKQVNMKLEKEKYVPTEKMTAGEAIDLWLKSKLPAGYSTDPEVRLSIPFQWKSLPVKDILIIGHPDAVDILKRNLLEFKTSYDANASPKIADYQVAQAAFYWLVIKKLTAAPQDLAEFNKITPDTSNISQAIVNSLKGVGIDCDCRVVKIWSNGKEGGTSEWTLQPQEKERFAMQTIDNALAAASKLDVEYQRFTELNKSVADRIRAMWDATKAAQ